MADSASAATQVAMRMPAVWARTPLRGSGAQGMRRVQRPMPRSEKRRIDGSMLHRSKQKKKKQLAWLLSKRQKRKNKLASLLPPPLRKRRNWLQLKRRPLPKLEERQSARPRSLSAKPNANGHTRNERPKLMLTLLREASALNTMQETSTMNGTTAHTMDTASTMATIKAMMDHTSIHRR